MDVTMVAVAECLACEFREAEPTTVMQVVAECVEEFPEVDPLFIEQAARAHLAETDGGLEGHDEPPRRV
jgi:hypothetical protein